MFLTAIRWRLSNYWFIKQQDPVLAKNSTLPVETSRMEQGWDPDVKKYLRKVMNSLFFGLLWLMAGVTAGLYYELAYSNGKPVIYTVLFYAGLLISLLLFIRYLYTTWKKDAD